MVIRSLGFASLLLLIAGDGTPPRAVSTTTGHHADRGAPSAVMAAMQQELARSMETLKARPVPAYFLSYEIVDRHLIAVEGAFGALNSSSDARSRTLGVDLRVGSGKFDNTHQIRGGMPSFDMGDRFSLAPLPIEDDALPIRRVLWHETDTRYKHAVERYARAKANTQLRVAAEDSSADFSDEPAVTATDTPIDVALDRTAWEGRIRKYTAPFARTKGIFDGEASLSAEASTRRYVNSDGSSIQMSSVLYRLIISASSKAADGMVLPRYESFVATTPQGLPDDAAVLKAVDRMIVDLHALERAPVVEAGTAPAILSGRASGVFFHEVFGHRVEGHRQKDETEGQTFKKMIGEKLLPDAFSVSFDPTMRRLGDVDLAGYYQYDDEGVKARRIDAVTKGVFERFLMSRSPIAGFDHSNGHGRAQPGFAPVARQSNLVVSTAQPVSHDSLKKMLVALINTQHKAFGFIFDDIEGGFTMTQRTIPNAFNVLPVMVYRVFPDGREELVRGVDLVGTPLTVFSRIIAGDDATKVFNGVCGAESGWVPVSASSPAILISQIEVQRKEKSQEQPPILPAPGVQP
ncbi:MAG: metallopeptidase TldD-related protein [bacterium]